MKTNGFRFHAIAWLRDEMSVRTDCLPHDEVEDEHGVAAIDGTIVRRTGNRPLELGALWMFAISYGLGMLTRAHGGSQLEALLMTSTCTAAFVAFVMLAAALWQRRRGRAAVTVMVRARVPRAGAADEAAIREARREAGRRRAWVLAEAGFTAGALALAASLGVHCFAPRGDRFVEVAAQPAPTVLASLS